MRWVTSQTQGYPDATATSGRSAPGSEGERDVRDHHNAGRQCYRCSRCSRGSFWTNSGNPWPITIGHPVHTPASIPLLAFTRAAAALITNLPVRNFRVLVLIGDAVGALFLERALPRGGGPGANGPRRVFER